MAGVAAAARLQTQGVKVTVLEARNRLGGRIWTDGSLGFPLDMGAMWIEGTQGNPVADVSGVREADRAVKLFS